MGQEMQRVERGQLWVMRVHALVPAMILIVAGSVLGLWLQEETGFPSALFAVSALLIALFIVLIVPGRHDRALGYRVDEDELHVARGVLVRTETVVPLNRVQHIDVSQGPAERAFGVSRLVLHTAGTMNSLVVLPGLARETAEGMRDSIRARIRQDEP